MMFEFFIISIGCFFAAFINASFATGGVYIMLAVVSSVVPLSVTITLMPALALPSLIARVYLFKSHIQIKIVKSFIIGSAMGVFLGGQLFVSIDERVISISIAVFILFLTWWPKITFTLPRFNAFYYAGFAHSFIGTLFGIGGILQPVIMRTSLSQAQITGTLAACLFTMDLFKISSYVSHGFSYVTYVNQLIAAAVFGFAGAWLGKRISLSISQKNFRAIFKLLITVVSLKLLIKGFMN